jgi:regulator of ribonuclease activity A
MPTDWSTADLSDAWPQARVVSAALRSFGGSPRFGGPAVTVRCPEDNSRVREALSEPGHSRVLVVDGGGSMRCALLGDLLGTLAVDNGWAGVVVWGAVRDAAILATLPLGVVALGTCPRKSTRRGEGQRDLVLDLPGATVRPGDWIYVDADGVLVGEGPPPG